jgi:hypothetical protein
MAEAKWGSLKNPADRLAVTKFMQAEAKVNGAGEFSGLDRLSIFVCRSPKMVYFLVKYGVRHIWAGSQDESWQENYNWNIYLLRRPVNRKTLEDYDSANFLDHEEATEAIEVFKEVARLQILNDKDTAKGR